jgi:hypothetical protein
MQVGVRLAAWTLTRGPEPNGWWVRDKEHGFQFKAKILKTIPPSYGGAGVIENLIS